MQDLTDRRQPPLDGCAARMPRHETKDVCAADIFPTMLPPSTANAPSASIAHLDHGMYRFVEELVVEVRSAETQESAIGSDSCEEPSVADRGDKTRAHEEVRLSGTAGTLHGRRDAPRSS